MKRGPWLCTLSVALLLVVLAMQPLPVRAESPEHGAHDSTTATSGIEHDPSHAPSSVHHDHPKPTPQESAYSVFMHHAAGVGMLIIGGLVLVDRLTGRRHPSIKQAVGLTWIGMGIFLFIRSDPEGWPMGPPGFIESFFIPTTSEWVQHKVLSMIPMFMGWYAIKGGSHPGPKTAATLWHYLAVGLASLGGVALLVHMHLDHPEAMDIVNFQHRLFAINALFIAASLVLDRKEQVRWKFKPYVLPIGFLLLGFQLVMYVE